MLGIGSVRVGSPSARSSRSPGVMSGYASNKQYSLLVGCGAAAQWSIQLQIALATAVLAGLVMMSNSPQHQSDIVNEQ